MNELSTTLETIKPLGLNHTLRELRAIKSISGNRIELEFGFPVLSQLKELANAIKNALQQPNLTIHIKQAIIPHQVQAGLKPLAGVKNIIAVASGKGGVGKSTVSVNLALALQYLGAKVGLLDADIYGPNQPHMLGAHRHPYSQDGKHMEPIVSHGLQTMSVGYLVERDTAMIWRGPMVTGALMQMISDTQWQDLDYLILDLPPGTGDIQLTLAQKIPVAGSVIVTTPQDIALLDVRKAINMFAKVKVNILGVVENMSGHVCSQCGNVDAIFGEEGGAHIANEFKLPLLGKIPLERRIRELADNGTPTMALEPESATGKLYQNLALQTAVTLSLQPKTYAHKFPEIVINPNSKKDQKHEH
ncbi:MAG: iron-sulfur cluster carrier protein ApbC [Legionellales bacterium]|nr:iron-sulfur cluster carrier protein ApbC [Legionellales bacterium]